MASPGNQHSANCIGTRMLKYKYVFQIKYTKAIYQKALGNCYGLKLPKCWLQFENKFIVLFIIIFGTLSFPVDLQLFTIVFSLRAMSSFVTTHSRTVFC